MKIIVERTAQYLVDVDISTGSYPEVLALFSGEQEEADERGDV